MGEIGSRPVRELTVGDVRAALEALSGRLSTRYLQIAKASLARAIRYAEAHDLVGRNVAKLTDPPKGSVGRPSRLLTLEQSLALLDAARESRLNAYVVLSLGRDPHRGGQGTALGSHRPGRRPGRAPACAAFGGCVAVGAPGREYQDS